MRITTGGAAAPFADDWTCGINLGNGHCSGLEAEPLFAADLVPVCTPSPRRTAAAARRPRRPASFCASRMRATTGRPGSRPPACRGSSPRGPEFEFYGQALQAAADGLGVAMGIRPYIDDDLAAGRLVTPFALTVPKGKQWYLVYRAARRDERDFVAFRDWLMRAARHDRRAAAEVGHGAPEPVALVRLADQG